MLALSKLEVRLRTSFFNGFSVEKQPASRGCVLLKHHRYTGVGEVSLFRESSFYLPVGVNWSRPFWEHVCDLGSHLCDC